MNSRINGLAALALGIALSTGCTKERIPTAEVVAEQGTPIGVENRLHDSDGTPIGMDENSPEAARYSHKFYTLLLHMDGGYYFASASPADDISIDSLSMVLQEQKVLENDQVRTGSLLSFPATSDYAFPRCGIEYIATLEPSNLRVKLTFFD
jgi:hypothetical protein